jgi:soluble lytic murein transglycosylase-like protein
MQLMPATAAGLHVDPGEASANASGGARYLRELLLRYKGDSIRALAAYNAGPGAVEKYNGAPPYQETRRYIVKVLAEYQKQLRANGAGVNGVSRKTGAQASKPSATD